MTSIGTPSGAGSAVQAPQVRPEIAETAGAELLQAARAHFERREPALFRGAAHGWPLVTKWSRSYLSRALGDFQCKVVRDSRPAYATETCSLAEYFERLSHLSTLTFSPTSAGERLPPFFDDVPLPNPFFARERITAGFLYHANADGGSLPHCHQDAYNILAQGRKRWVMYDADPDESPEGWALLRACHEEFGAGTFATDWFSRGIEHIEARGITVYQCVQEPGDVVYIPEHFSHAVLNDSEVLGLAILVDRPGKDYQRAPGDGFSPNAAYDDSQEGRAPDRESA